jgi:lycopene beta-cyclase
VSSSDAILLGGGLANGLLAFRLAAVRKDLRFALFERGETLGGNHTWCFHQSDVSPSTFAWLEPLISRRWSGHSVEFKTLSRTLSGTYCCIRSEDFHQKLMQTLGSRVHLAQAATVDHQKPDTVIDAGGQRHTAPVVIDGSGFSLDRFPQCGFQKFLGLELRLRSPHQLVDPVLMDARVEQRDGFRYVYCLPFDSDRVLIEDTCYSNDPAIDAPGYRQRLLQYAESKGWPILDVVREECGVLPITLTGDVPTHSIATVGVKAGFFNAATGYSLPAAAHVADVLAGVRPFNADTVMSTLKKLQREHWASQSFVRMLNRMLFRAADPLLRERVFTAFYQHDQALVFRFYAGRLTAFDKLKVLARGAPTVPTWTAIAASLNLK